MRRLLIVTALLAAPACASDQQDNETTPPATTAAKPAEASGGVTVGVDPEVAAKFRQERDEFVAAAKVRMGKIDARIDAIQADLDAHGAELKADAKAELVELRADLEKQRVEIKASFEAAGDVTQDKWEDFKRASEDAFVKIEAGAKTTVGKLKSAGIKVRVELEDALD
ncbi:MAG TPA: hypothetical protein VMZ28_13015 [Kofleriaceae bacterium]|nr:hypothetical protein [Kofleriaceae bacterium]